MTGDCNGYHNSLKSHTPALNLLDLKSNGIHDHLMTQSINQSVRLKQSIMQ